VYFFWWGLFRGKGKKNSTKTFSYLNNEPGRDLAISPLCSATSDLVIEARTS